MYVRPEDGQVDIMTTTQAKVHHKLEQGDIKEETLVASDNKITNKG